MSVSLLLFASSIQQCHFKNLAPVIGLMLIKLNMQFCVGKVEMSFSMHTHFKESGIRLRACKIRFLEEAELIILSYGTGRVYNVT
jgi:hypothetical protein